MFDNFIPNTDLERAFAQTAAWEIDKLWREADRNGNRGDWSKFFGQSCRLAYQHAVLRNDRHLNTITSAMVSNLPHLDDSQRNSLLKVCEHTIRALKDLDLVVESIQIRLLLRVMCATLNLTQHDSIDYIFMRRKLAEILDRQLEKNEVQQLIVLCEKAAESTRRLPLSQLELERKEAFLSQFQSKA